MVNTEVTIGKLTLKNPVMTASGTFGYGEEYSEFVDLSRLGALVVKGISLKPMEGNPPPRISETPCGMLNAIGLQNIGLKKFINEKLPFIKGFDTCLIVNILGRTIDEYVRLSTELEASGLSAIELNVSCPNVKSGGIEFGTSQKALGRLTRKVRKAFKGTLIVKLSPKVSDIREFARLSEAEGADAISLINTVPAMAINIKTRMPVLSNVTGGLSGPAIKPIALRMVWEVASAVKIPIIGMGGIMNASDAIEFILAGATGVAVGTSNFRNPASVIEIIDGIESYMRENGIKHIKELIRGIIC
ncbi:MAG: dihydroorotate dehydrogenase [Nitrospirae bacterium]|nr:dihydroorotate dehydrogenase [Nitrospirota bacterium]